MRLTLSIGNSYCKTDGGLILKRHNAGHILKYAQAIAKAQLNGYIQLMDVKSKYIFGFAQMAFALLLH